MILIGLTGGMGSGKSSVSVRLAAKGAVVIDADAITRSLQAPGQPVLEQMVARFGPAALADLNAIVHPAVGAEIARRLGEESATDHVVVLDVPLLVESGRNDLRALIVVDVDPEVAVDRLVRFRGVREDDARARMARQASREQRLASADLVIDNGGSEADLDREVERAWTWIQALGPNGA